MHVDTYVIKFDDIEVNDRVTYQERTMRILEHRTKKLRNKEIPLVKVQWKYHDEREASWDLETTMRVKFLYLFAD